MNALAVVPIFMSAGAAVLPTVLAAVTSIAAILFKPRELLRVIRQNPKTAAGSVALMAVGIGASFWWWLAPASSRADLSADARAEMRPNGPRYDWMAVARGIIDEEKAGRVPTVVDSDNEAGTGSAVVIGNDFTRSSFLGGKAPEQLFEKWEFNVEGYSFWSTVVFRNRIFSAGSFADTKVVGQISCIDAGTGKKIWATTPATGDLHPIFSCPAITADGKYLVVGEGLHEDADCQLRCFDAHTGELRWSVQTPLHIESSPAISGDLVVVGCGAIEGDDGKATGDPGHVLAVRISDGKELWRQPVNDPESSPAIDERGMVYIGSGFNGNAVVAIRSQSDEDLHAAKLDRIAWRTAVAQPVTSAITLSGDSVIAGAGNSDFAYANPHPEGWVVALDRATGKMRWQTKFPDAVLGEVSAREGKVICPVRTGSVAALDLGDGHLLWQTPISGTAPVLAGCAFTGSRVYAVSSDGYLAVIDAADGKILSKVYINSQLSAGKGTCFASPQVGNGRVIVGSETGGIRCYVGSGGGR